MSKPQTFFRSLGVLILSILLLSCGANNIKDTQENGDAGTNNVFEVSGFSTPESVLYDGQGDIYLVSNIGGEPQDKDDNGFISKVSTKGEILELKWIDGASDQVTLNAPKGSGIIADELFVADIDVVRIFNRMTGEPRGEVEIDEAEFLNDIAVGEDGVVYVSDSSADAVFKILKDRTYQTLASGDLLKGPNGLAFSNGDLWVTVGQTVLRLDAEGSLTETRNVPNDGLDGLVILKDGTFVVSSWGGKALYWARPGAEFQELFTALTSPADIGVDTARQLVLIPLFSDNKILAKKLPIQ